MAQAFIEDRAKVKKDVFAAEKDKVETQAKQVALAGQILGSISDEPSFYRGIGQALSNGLIGKDEAQSFLAKGWTPETQATMTQFRQQALTAQQALDEKRKMVKDAEDALRAEDERRKLKAEAKIAEQEAAGTKPIQPAEQARIDAEERRAKATEAYRAQMIAGQNKTQQIIAQTGLSNQQGQRVLSISGQFDNEPNVKRYNVVKEAEDFTKNLGGTSSDDQALIYSFAKAMDPDSVVRDGEYNTVQRYAQSWAEKFGFDVKRIFSNTEFLTPKAREQMKNVIRMKAQASAKAYENTANEYGRRINMMAGVKNGREFLTDYSRAYAQDAKPDAAKPGTPTKGAPVVGGMFNGKKILAVEKVK
jgi:hypothetical protein